MSWVLDNDPEFERDLDWIREFMTTQVWPLEVLDMDDKEFEVILRTLQAEVKVRRLWAAHLPPELGGQGLGQVKLAQINEIIGSSFWGPYVFGCQAPDSGNAEILALVGTPEQKARWLDPLLDGQIYSAFSMTEPAHAGSDPTRMSTTATRDGDDWVINGHKWFSSNAKAAEFLIVMAVTDPEAEPHRRASMFIVPKDAPGLDVVRNVPTMIGAERMDFGHPEVRYDNCRIDASNILGGVGDGFKIAQMRLGPGRIHHCMRWLGQAQRAFDIMCERALQRTVRGKALADSDLIRSWIAESKAEMDAARLLTLRAAWVIDTHGVKAAKTDIAVIKFFGADVLNRVIDRAIQVNGALGFSGDLPLEHMYRRARAARFVDGADEVHKGTVARQVLADSDLIRSWIAESKAEMDAARLLTLRAAWVIDTHGVKAAKTDIAVIKFFGADVLNRVIDRAIQVNGALGFSGDLPLEHMYRRARAARFVDGADEVHKGAVARQVLAGYSVPDGPWPTDHVPTRRDAAKAWADDVLVRGARVD